MSILPREAGTVLQLFHQKLYINVWSGHITSWKH